MSRHAACAEAKSHSLRGIGTYGLFAFAACVSLMNHGWPWWQVVAAFMAAGFVNSFGRGVGIAVYGACPKKEAD